MPHTIIEKIIQSHAERPVTPGDIVDVKIDVRLARDFGGANVVKNLQNANLPIANPELTFFTFDCNPGGSDQKYASNQHLCRRFARENNIQIFDLPEGIGTHIAIEKGLARPGDTLVSTDSHANILGAIGAFGQGMGDQDIAATWAFGKVWFKVPPTIKVMINGTPSAMATAKDITLAILKSTGANGLLGYAAEFYGKIVDSLNLASRITIASMNTEMGGIIGLFPPNENVLKYCEAASRQQIRGVFADLDAKYDSELNINIDSLEPLISRPGHPEDITSVKSLFGTKIDSAFIGSCTNGRFEDLKAAAEILKGRKVAPGIVLKIVPATDSVWQQCLQEGLFDIFKAAGALIGNAGCAGCANGQIGQNGPGEVTISTGNRNFTGKQGQGEVYLASPATVAASAIAGQICTADSIPSRPAIFSIPKIQPNGKEKESAFSPIVKTVKPTTIQGRVWVIQKDNIDTDMIFHNRHLAITDLAQMGQFAFGNLAGWENFNQKVQPGDIIMTGKNFGAGSSRQQAVDCFKILGIALIIAESFGAIYERNAINAGLPIMSANWTQTDIQDGERIEVNLNTGQILRLNKNEIIQANPFSTVQMEIYQRDGLLK
ncbi:3-isopropylmalate dehydratase large subunit [candidate division KSB1 bacterium]|nr:3-isopropylmalate dehydratase large subunit [candidate division KSB1 bacterium]